MGCPTCADDLLLMSNYPRELQIMLDNCFKNSIRNKCTFHPTGASIIACPLSHVINLSLIQGTIPDDLKSARVVPIFKRNDRTEVGNYRPVSILTIISKIFEKVVYDQVESYLDQKKASLPISVRLQKQVFD